MIGSGIKYITLSIFYVSEPLPPQVLAAGNVGTDSITFSWSPGTNSAQDKYVYQYRDVSAQEAFTTEAEVTDTQVPISGLSAGHQYEFKVLAVSGKQRSAAVTETQATSK